MTKAGAKAVKADVTAREREPHLRDLFQTGKEIKIAAATMQGLKRISVWMRAPNPDQTQMAIRKAGARQARERSAYRDKTSDRYQTAVGEIGAFETREDLLEFLTSTEEEDNRQRAFNEVLYGDDWGSNWSGEDKKDDRGNVEKEALDYLGMLEALYSRQQEIRAHNAEPDSEKILAEEDPVIIPLQRLYDLFQSEVDERKGEIRAERHAVLNRSTDDALREMVLKKVIDLECRTAWLDEYQKWMTFYSVRRMNDKKALYFDNPDEMAELPDEVMAQINDGYRDVTRAGTDLKDWPSPASGSDLSGLSGELEEALTTSSQTD